MTEVKEEQKRFNPTLIIMAIIGISFMLFVVMAPPGKNAPGGALIVGSQAPDFNLTDLDGKQWSLESLKGSAVVINFWATWCPPCREEMPSLSELFELNRGSEGLQILTILYRDVPDNAKAYFSDQGFKMPVLIDPRGKVAKRFGLAGVPETFVIDKKGILKKHFIGPVDFVSPEARMYIENLANQ